MAEYASLIPVNVLTGFLGSGKTTLLQRLLRDPALGDTAVLLNEFGEAGLDHQLLQHVDEQTVLLQSGCVCCSIRGDLKEAIRDLYSRRERGEVPPFRRLVIETTGLADPVPIAYTLLTEPVIRHHFRMGNVVTTIDAINGLGQLERFPESLKQAAIADRLVLTKTDLATDPPGQSALQALRERLRTLNHSAPLLDAQAEGITPDALLLRDIHDPAGKAREIEGWLGARGVDYLNGGGHGNGSESRPARGSAPGGQAPHPYAQGPHTHDPFIHDPFIHDSAIRSFTLTFDTPLDWSAFGIWLTMLLAAHGENVLRVKGLLDVVGEPAPLVVQGVQHIVHPLTHLNAWPAGERRSRLIFIVTGLAPEALGESLETFNRLSNP